MPPLRLAAAAVCAAALAVPATASAVPPLNDNYLQSTIVSNNPNTGLLPTDWRDDEPTNTAEATEQADIFNPDVDGNPTPGGGGPEPLNCRGTAISKTVWYDLHPPTWGGVEFDVAGFDAGVTVYELNANNGIKKVVWCQNDDPGASEQVLFDVKKGRSYTVQVGGVNGASGPLSTHVLYFRDSDNDGALDSDPQQEHCKKLPGTVAGCPPTVRGTARYATSGAIPPALTMLSVQGVQKGSKVEVSCSHCGKKFTKTSRKGGVVKVTSFVGRTLRAGDHLVIRITHKATGKGRFKFGAFGRYYSYAVTSAGIGKRTDRCTNPGSRKPVKCKD
jgi:hypothetical protein